jgi:ABC-type Na+ transport system ATPase subunit NatA
LRYQSFRIQNFKGIKDTTINLHNVAGASVFAFVGLNESGKTTILEAIHSFKADTATSEILGGDEGTGVPFKERVPRHLLSEFNGEVSVLATIMIDSKDKEQMVKDFSAAGYTLDSESIPDSIQFRRMQRFVNGDLKGAFFSMIGNFRMKRSSQKNWRDSKEFDAVNVRDIVFKRVPSIAYFPTFVFNFPKSIFLTERGGVVDKFYRSVFQDILDYDGRGQTIQRDIVGRIQKSDLHLPWMSFLPIWSTKDDKDKIQQVVDRAGAAVTKLVFGRWNKIFGEDTKGKEIIISYEIIEGEEDDEAGNKVKKNVHDVLVKFQIKDGTRRFDVNDRSLGFRWFFSFMLFTQFRVARAAVGQAPLLFLFDEPASNLHAAAQQKLIESFPEVAQNGHVLAYSTHSHYMIEPKWLEQTFIVTNRSDSPSSSLLDDASLDEESLDIKAQPYRAFVNEHPSQTSYFQPILDRLEVVPSKFDMHMPSVVVEGKSDYYILRYACRALQRSDIALLPALGAGTFGSLAALHVGWNLNFVFLVDADRQGLQEKRRYTSEFGISAEQVVTLAELCPEVAMIEDLLDEKASKAVAKMMGADGAATKDQIRRFFQERLASDNVDPLSSEFLRLAGLVIDGLEIRLGAKAGKVKRGRRSKSS